MKYLVLLFRAVDATECETYWTDDYEDAMNVSEEYHSFTIVHCGVVESYNVNGED